VQRQKPRNLALEAGSLTPAVLRRCRVRENIAELVNDFLPDLVFEKVVFARRTQHPRFQDFMLLLKQRIQFNPQLLSIVVCHKILFYDGNALVSQAALR
jgi:acetone carboxylase gamma subunit